MSGIVVIKVGGSTLEDVERLRPLWALLASLPGVVIVHGGGKTVDALLGRLNIAAERKNGLRVTPPEQINLIAGVLAGTVNKQLVGALNASGGRAVGLCLGDGAMVACRVLSQDLGRVGTVEGGSADLLRLLLDQRYIPVVSSIGIDDSGGLLNINADDAAAGVAAALGASRLVLLTDVPGIKGRDGVVRTMLTRLQIEEMIASGEISGGMMIKARSALAAAHSTGAAVVILSGESPEPLLSLLQGHAIGTTIHPGNAAGNHL